MMRVDLLSDTTYREQAVEQLDRLLGNSTKFPVDPTQIYGLRQIARQEPVEVENFAKHQGERAQSRYDAENEKSNPRTDVLQSLEAEIKFWTLVPNLCNDLTSDWSVPKEGQSCLPAELQNIPPKVPGMSQEERSQINKLVKRRQGWLEKWKNEHIPAFFERFCTHCLYCIAKAEMRHLGGANEAHMQAQQDKNEVQDTTAMQEGFQNTNLIE